MKRGVHAKLTTLGLATLALSSLSACANSVSVVSRSIYAYDTVWTITLYAGAESLLDDLETMVKATSTLFDRHTKTEGNVYDLNLTNEAMTVDPRLYELLQLSLAYQEETAGLYSPFLGGLLDLWEVQLAMGCVPDEDAIKEELDLIEGTSLVFGENYTVQRLGEGQIDLGGIAKGYCLDLIKTYLDDKNQTRYLVSGGTSSILFGKTAKDGEKFTVTVRDIEESKFSYTCVDEALSCSSISEQHTEIEGVAYSHIINPLTGSAIPLHEVALCHQTHGSHAGVKTDAYSTALMNMELDQALLAEAEGLSICLASGGEVTYRTAQ